MKNKKILIVAPHADDEVIGCGGFIGKYKNQNDIHIMYIARPSYLQQVGLTRVTSDVKGVKYIVFAYPDQELDTVPKHTFIDLIKGYITTYDIDTVFMPYIHDANEDHRVIAKCTKIACRPYDTTVKNLLMYEIPETTMLADIPFTPNYYVKLNGFKGKMKLLKYYTEILGTNEYHPRSIRFLERKSQIYAVQSGLKPFAEAFQIVRMTES